MDWHWPPLGACAVIATQHGKEQAIAPVLAPLGLDWRSVPAAFDSDQFGTFTREIPRAGSQIAAARAKVTSALMLCPDARIAIASEGAFGPDPVVPILPMASELVLLRDRWTGLELVGRERTWDTNYAHRTVATLTEAEAFARACGFPEHGLVVMNDAGDRPIVKDIGMLPVLRETVRRQLRATGRCWLETDMRAHRNPRRLAAIARAAAALCEAAYAVCPQCARPGFTARKMPGRPCGWCGAETHDLWREARHCDGCQYEICRICDADRHADPGLCLACNP